MTATHYVSTGITVSFGTLAGELQDVKIGGEKADTVDVSHQGSSWKAFKAALLDGGEVTLTLAFDPDAAIDVLGTTGTLIVHWPSGATKGYSASAILTGKSVTASLGQKITLDLTFKITGQPSWTYT